MNFSICIPTRNRHNDLGRCLDSILSQKLLPNEVIIIDDGKLEKNFLFDYEKIYQNNNIKLYYYKKNHQIEEPGTSSSRNIGLNLTTNDIVLFLDDDLILEKKFCLEIIDSWKQSDDKTLGVGGVITNNRRRNLLELFYNYVFGLGSSLPWDVNNLSFQTWNDFVDNPTKGYYIHGGVSAYKKNIAKIIGFKNFNKGRVALEDVDFCLRAKNAGYHFLINPRAQVIHNHSQTARESGYITGVKESINRWAIFKDNCPQNNLNRVKFYWANVGWILRQFLSGQLTKGYGMLYGFILRPKI